MLGMGLLLGELVSRFGLSCWQCWVSLGWFGCHKLHPFVTGVIAQFELAWNLLGLQGWKVWCVLQGRKDPSWIGLVGGSGTSF